MSVVQDVRVQEVGDDPWERAAVRATSWLVILGWVALLGTSWVLAERPTSFRELEAAVAAGDVEQIRVAHAPSKLGGVVELHWRAPWSSHVTELLAVDRPGSREPLPAEGLRPAAERDVVEALRRVRPDLVFVPEEGWNGIETDLFGWRLPGWVGLALLLAWMATFVHLLFAPRPWVATRSGWGWLVVLVPAVGVPGYLLLGGPSGLRVRSRTGKGAAPRLTGGRGLVLALVLAAVLRPV